MVAPRASTGSIFESLHQSLQWELRSVQNLCAECQTRKKPQSIDSQGFLISSTLAETLLDPPDWRRRSEFRLAGRVQPTEAYGHCTNHCICQPQRRINRPVAAVSRARLSSARFFAVCQGPVAREVSGCLSVVAPEGRRPLSPG